MPLPSFGPPCMPGACLRRTNPSAASFISWQEASSSLQHALSMMKSFETGKYCHGTSAAVLLSSRFHKSASPQLRSSSTSSFASSVLLNSPSPAQSVCQICPTMATTGTKLSLLLGLLVAALVLTAAQEDKKNVTAAAAPPSVMIYNPAGLVVDIQNNDKNVLVTAEMEMVTVELTQAQTTLRFSVAGGNAVDVSAHDGDVLALIPDPSDPQNVQAFKVVVSGEEPQPDVEASIPQSDTAHP